ncbi:hypothetical protein TNCT_313751 [Trichonephila clavata]|uniref:Uncharacterized protein n=1 Tax=Trichonephila clavata TaxID=2740835 RepID=A0A8X6K6K9_TRICU|nr:hypothetical protein TNCT_313751 [Trichonephila clavata]
MASRSNDTPKQFTYLWDEDRTRYRLQEKNRIKNIRKKGKGRGRMRNYFLVRTKTPITQTASVDASFKASGINGSKPPENSYHHGDLITALGGAISEKSLSSEGETINRYKGTTTFSSDLAPLIFFLPTIKGRNYRPG